MAFDYSKQVPDGTPDVQQTSGQGLFIPENKAITATAQRGQYTPEQIAAAQKEIQRQQDQARQWEMINAQPPSMATPGTQQPGALPQFKGEEFLTNPAVFLPGAILRGAGEGAVQGAQEFANAYQPALPFNLQPQGLQALAGLVKAGGAAATPFVPGMAAFTAGSQLASQVPNPQVQNALQWLGNPVTRATQPTSPQGKAAAEIGDTAAQLLAALLVHKGLSRLAPETSVPPASPEPTQQGTIDNGRYFGTATGPEEGSQIRGLNPISKATEGRIPPASVTYRTERFPDGVVWITASEGGKDIGHVVLKQNDTMGIEGAPQTHSSISTWVDEPSRRRGIATGMYQEAQKEGLNVIPSSNFTPEGEQLQKSLSREKLYATPESTTPSAASSEVSPTVRYTGPPTGEFKTGEEIQAPTTAGGTNPALNPATESRQHMMQVQDAISSSITKGWDLRDAQAIKDSGKNNVEIEQEAARLIGGNDRLNAIVENYNTRNMMTRALKGSPEWWQKAQKASPVGQKAVERTQLAYNIVKALNPEFLPQPPAEGTRYFGSAEGGEDVPPQNPAFRKIISGEGTSTPNPAETRKPGGIAGMALGMKKIEPEVQKAIDDMVENPEARKSIGKMYQAGQLIYDPATGNLNMNVKPHQPLSRVPEGWGSNQLSWEQAQAQLAGEKNAPTFENTNQAREFGQHMTAADARLYADEYLRHSEEAKTSKADIGSRIKDVTQNQFRREAVEGYLGLPENQSIEGSTPAEKSANLKRMIDEKEGRQQSRWFGTSDAGTEAFKNIQKAYDNWDAQSIKGRGTVNDEYKKLTGQDMPVDSKDVVGLAYRRKSDGHSILEDEIAKSEAPPEQANPNEGPPTQKAPVDDISHVQNALQNFYDSGYRTQFELKSQMKGNTAWEGLTPEQQDRLLNEQTGGEKGGWFGTSEGKEPAPSKTGVGGPQKPVAPRPGWMWDEKANEGQGEWVPYVEPSRYSPTLPGHIPYKEPYIGPIRPIGDPGTAGLPSTKESVYGRILYRNPITGELEGPRKYGKLDEAMGADYQADKPRVPELTEPRPATEFGIQPKGEPNIPPPTPASAITTAGKLPSYSGDLQGSTIEPLRREIQRIASLKDSRTGRLKYLHVAEVIREMQKNTDFTALRPSDQVAMVRDELNARRAGKASGTPYTPVPRVLTQRQQDLGLNPDTDPFEHEGMRGLPSYTGGERGEEAIPLATGTPGILPEEEAQSLISRKTPKGTTEQGSGWFGTSTGPEQGFNLPEPNRNQNISHLQAGAGKPIVHTYDDYGGRKEPIGSTYVGKDKEMHQPTQESRTAQLEGRVSTTKDHMALWHFPDDVPGDKLADMVNNAVNQGELNPNAIVHFINGDTMSVPEILGTAPPRKRGWFGSSEPSSFEDAVSRYATDPFAMAIAKRGIETYKARLAEINKDIDLYTEKDWGKNTKNIRTYLDSIQKEKDDLSGKIDEMERQVAAAEKHGYGTSEGGEVPPKSPGNEGTRLAGKATRYDPSNPLNDLYSKMLDARKELTRRKGQGYGKDKVAEAQQAFNDAMDAYRGLAHKTGAEIPTPTPEPIDVSRNPEAQPIPTEETTRAAEMAPETTSSKPIVRSLQGTVQSLVDKGYRTPTLLKEALKNSARWNQLDVETQNKMLEDALRSK